MDLASLLGLIWTHFVADFVFQNNYMSLNKSKNVKALALHCLVYGICFIWFGLIFALLNMVSHFLVDFITSKITHHLWKENKVHAFFVVIGCDQAIHFSIMIILFKLVSIKGVIV